MEVERDPQTPTPGDAGASSSSSSSSSTSTSTSTSATTTTAVSSNSFSLTAVAKNRRTAMVKGRWTSQEHADFLVGLEKYGKDWKAIADVVKTRTTVQTRTHHQKYEKQVKRGRKFPEEPYEDDDDGGGGGSGRSGRKPPRTKAIRPSRAGILISPTPVTVRGKRLLTPHAGGGNGNGGGGSRGRPRSTRAAAAKAKAEADAAKAMAEASAARVIEAEARAAEAVAATAAAETAAPGRVGEEDAGEGSSDAEWTAGTEYRPEKRVKTGHLSADCDAAAGTSCDYGRQLFSFPSSITAPGTATPPTVAEVPPSPRKEAALTKSVWSSFGNLAAQGQPATSGEVGMEEEVGSYFGDRELSGGASAMPVKAVTEASAGGGSGFTSCQLSPFLCETFLDAFVVGGGDAEALPAAAAAAAAPAFSMAASSSPPTFAGGHNVKTERSGQDKQEGDDGLLLARPGSSFSSTAAATAAGYNAQQSLQQQQQQQRLQQAQQQQQQRVLLSSGSAGVAAFGGLPDSTATLYPGTPFDPTATGISIPGIGGLEYFSPNGYAAGFGSMSEGNGVVVGSGGGILNPFSAASTSPVFFRRSDFGGGGGVLDDKLEFPGGVGMAGVVGETGVRSLKHDDQAFGLDKRLAAFRQQQQQRMLDQVFHFRPNSAPAEAIATSMLSSSSSSFGDADAAHKLRRAAAAISPGVFDMDCDGSSSSSSSKGHKQDDVATSSGMSSDSGSSSGGDTLSSDGLTDELTGYGSEGWPDDGMENLEQFDVLAVFAFDDHFGIL